MPGGAAGAVGRITGALGKGIATLTMDEDYKRKRQEALNKRPANVGEGFARGGQSLVMVSSGLILCCERDNFLVALAAVSFAGSSV